MHRLTPLERDYYLDHDDVGGGGRSDDDDDSGSSEDEMQRTFAGIAGVMLPSQRKRELKQDRSFEAEMERELDASFQEHSAAWRFGKTSVARPSEQIGEKSDYTTKAKERRNNENDADPALGLNDQGTESDEEFQRNEGLEGSAEETDADNLFYDPDEDEANQNWIDNHRRSYQPKPSQHRPLPKSDAVLNCPACMTVLCLDCQRHDIYKTQYRAMFVTNCEVKRDELLYQPKSQKRGGTKKRKNDAAPKLKSGERLTTNEYDADAIENIKKNSRAEDLFYPVVCQVCKTEVGVYDSDEVYHFFNILASYA